MKPFENCTECSTIHSYCNTDEDWCKHGSKRKTYTCSIFSKSKAMEVEVRALDLEEVMFKLASKYDKLLVVGIWQGEKLVYLR